MSEAMKSENKTFYRIRRTGATEEIVSMIKSAMMSDELRPGDRLPTEAELVEQTGVGRNSVREAMKMLSALGVVDIRRGDGTYITSEPSSRVLNPLVFAMLLKTKTSKELIELRTMIEISYCQLAAQNATDDDLYRINQAKEAWETQAGSPQPDIEQLTDFDLAFHFAILNATHNTLVITMGQMVEDLYFISIREALSKKEVIEWGFKGHQRILDALHTRDPETIRQAVEFSLTYWGRILE
jgi:GntR family transcriptional regulator, transcriptional repressor for pyruvate dehydrogenase complex